MNSVSPLAEIRAAELAAARSVAAAREEAAQRLAAARSEAVEMVERARAAGRTLADQRYEAALETARRDADEIARSVDERVLQLDAQVTPELDRLVEAMLGVVVIEEE